VQCRYFYTGGYISILVQCRYFYTGGYFSILVGPCSIYGGAIESPDHLLSYFIISLASHITIILTFTFIFIYQTVYAAAL